MLQFIRQHPEVSDDEMVDLLWAEFHRPMDRFGVQRLRALLKERQSRHKPKDPPGGQGAGLFGESAQDGAAGDGADAPAADVAAESDAAAESEDRQPEEPDAGARGDAASAVGDLEADPGACCVPAFLARPGASLYAGLCLSLPFLSGLGLAQWAAQHPLPGEHRLSTISRLLGFVGLSLSRITAPEGAKETWPGDFAPFVGAPRLMSDRTLRRTAHVLGGEAESLVLTMGGELARTWTSDERPLVYLDGHFLAYSGAHHVAKGYNTRRRLAMPGHMSTYLDLRVGTSARPLLFHVAAGDDPFRARVLFLKEQFRSVTGKQPTLIFDRGAVGWEMFDQLLTAQIPFIAYAPESAAKGLPADAAFQAETVVRDGRRRTYLIYSYALERPQGTLRLHAFRPEGKADKTIVVADALPTPLPTAEVLQLLWSRWGIENSFKLFPEFGLNHFGVHRVLGTEELLHGVDAAARVENPKARTLKRKLRALRQKLLELEDRYGSELAGDMVVNLGQDAPPAARAQWEETVTQFAALQEQLLAEPSSLTRGELLRREGREGFDYGPKFTMPRGGAPSGMKTGHGQATPNGLNGVCAGDSLVDCTSARRLSKTGVLHRVTSGLLCVSCLLA
jgi:hypothetical protein